MESILKDSLEIAKEYLHIVEEIEIRGNYTKQEEDWLIRNCIKLQDDMEAIGFKQIKPGLKNGFGQTLYKIEKIVGVFPMFLRVPFPLDEHFIFSTLKANLHGYIRKVEELLKKPKKLKKKKIGRIIEFDKIKAIELIFIGVYITSIIFLIIENSFIFGFILNLISVIAILIISLIKLGRNLNFIDH